MEPETAEQSYDEIFKCFVCQSPLGWSSMRRHLKEQHPDTDIPPRMNREEWPPTAESYGPRAEVGSMERIPCYVCRKVFIWRYMRDHVQKEHPDIVLPARISKHDWPPTQHAAGISRDPQAIVPETGPPEVPIQQSQWVDYNAFSIMDRMSTNQSRDDKQRDRTFKSGWPIMQDAAARSPEEQAATPRSELSEVPKQQSRSAENNAFQIMDVMDTDQTSNDEQRNLIDLPRGSVAAKAIRDDRLPVMDKVFTDQTPSNGQHDYIDLTHETDESLRAETTRDDAFLSMGETNVNQTPYGERGDHSDFLHWDTVAEARPDDVLQFMNEMNMNQTPNDEQGDYSGFMDWDAVAAATRGNVLPTMDEMSINQVPGHEREDYTALIAWAADETKRQQQLPSTIIINIDQTSNDGQRARVEPNDEHSAEAIFDDVSPTKDGINVNRDLDNEQLDDMELTHGNAADAVMSTVFRLAMEDKIMSSTDSDDSSTRRW